jgi:hypothetical protein
MRCPEMLIDLTVDKTKITQIYTEEGPLDKSLIILSK